MILPLPVQDLQEEVLLQDPHGLGTKLSLPGRVFLPGKGQEPLFKGIHISFEGAHRGLEPENCKETITQPIQIPFVVVSPGIDMELDHFLERLLDQIIDPFGQIFRTQDLPSLPVNRFALHVHDIVVLEDMFSDVEVVALYPLLGVLNGLGDHPVLDLLSLSHSQPLHESGDPLGTENTHEIVFKTQKKPGTARVTLTTGSSPQLVIDPPALMALCSQDMQASRFQDRDALLLAKFLHLFQDLPVLLRIGVFYFVPGKKDGVASQNDIRSPSCHVGCYGYGTRPPSLGHNISLSFMMLGVENVVSEPLPLHHPGEKFRALDGRSAHQDRLAPMLAVGYLFNHRVVLLLHGTINEIRVVQADHGHVGRHHSHIQVVDVLELSRFSIRCPCHTRQLVIHAKEVLEGDGRKGLVFALDLDPLFGLQSLMQPIAVTSSRHETTGKLVHNEHLVVLDDIIHIPFKKSVGL